MKFRKDRYQATCMTLLLYMTTAVILPNAQGYEET